MIVLQDGMMDRLGLQLAQVDKDVDAKKGGDHIIVWQVAHLPFIS